ncbi:MAG TPA: flagellar filament capping protein FliD [Terracidiphilus sp.]|nr:flagellar filament capping protein FliD [Terracidiphilus sp.]
MSSISSALSSLLGSNSSSSTGIDISSILEALTGASSSGLDVTSAVNAAVTAAQAPETAWNNQLVSLENQTSALQQIQTDVQSLDNDVQQLNSITGPLASNTVSSSNSGIVTATAASGTALGTHVVTVNNLASTATWTSGEFASSSTDLPAGSFTITTGSGATTITTDGTQSLSDVASQINGDNLGVTASVITDANGARLAIVANSSGAASNFTISGPAGFGFTQPVTGTNASLTVDGVPISSASDTVSGALPGVTLNLLGASAGAQVTLNVQPDTSSASTAINQFVTDYNKVMSDINAQFTDTSSGQGPLAQDPNIINLQNVVEQSLSYLGTGSSVNLNSLGISFNNDGSMTVDSSTLQNTLQNNFAGVQSFFQGSALNGFANNMDQQLTSFLAPANGAFTVDLQSMNSQETTLKTDITNFQTNVIDPLQTSLTSQFSQAETELQELPMELKQISAEFGNNSNSNG